MVLSTKLLIHRYSYSALCNCKWLCNVKLRASVSFETALLQCPSLIFQFFIDSVFIINMMIHIRFMTLILV